MKSCIKAIMIGSFLSIGMGIIGYLVVAFYMILILGMTDSSEMLDIFYLRETMYWSMPYSFIVLAVVTYFSTRKLSSHHYIVGMAVILLTALSITIEPFSNANIHGNYLPIIIGGLVGSFIGAKLNQGMHATSGE